MIILNNNLKIKNQGLKNSKMYNNIYHNYKYLIKYKYSFRILRTLMIFSFFIFNFLFQFFYFSNDIYAQQISDTFDNYRINIKINGNLLFINKFNQISINNIKFNNYFEIKIYSFSFYSNKQLIFYKKIKTFKSKYRIDFYISENTSKILLVINIDGFNKITKFYKTENPLLFQKIYFNDYSDTNLKKIIKTLTPSFKLLKVNDQKRLEIFDIIFLNFSNIFKKSNKNVTNEIKNIYNMAFNNYLNLIILYNDTKELNLLLNIFKKNLNKTRINLNNNNIKNSLYIAYLLNHNYVIFLKQSENSNKKLFLECIKKILEKIKLEKINYFERFYSINFKSKIQSYIEFLSKNRAKLNIENINQTIKTIDKYYYKPKIIKFNSYLFIGVLIFIPIFLFLFYKFKIYRCSKSILFIFLFLFIYNYLLFTNRNSILEVDLKLPLNILSYKYVFINSQTIINKKNKSYTIHLYLKNSTSTNLSKNTYFIYKNILSQNNIYPVKLLKNYIFIKINNNPITIEKNNKFYLKFNRNIKIIGIKSE